MTTPEPRKLATLTPEEIDHIKTILKNEYYYSTTTEANNFHDVVYQVFTKSHAVYSGLGVIRVHEYLKTLGMNVLNEYK